MTLLFVTVLRLGMGLGYANNRDFWRAMAPSGIVYRAGLSDVSCSFVTRSRSINWGRSAKFREVMSSLEDLVVRAAVILQKAVAPAATARGVFHCFA